jgi:hypothetical protein
MVTYPGMRTFSVFVLQKTFRNPGDTENTVLRKSQYRFFLRRKNSTEKKKQRKKEMFHYLADSSYTSRSVIL